MKRMFRSVAAIAIATVFSLGAASNAQAIEAFDGRIELHGYAHQAFLLSNSNTNNYLKADNHGSFELNALALLFSFKATDDLTVWTQLFAGNESNMRLDWAFADYRVNDWLRVRGGQIKTPLGLLNETRDIKYLHLATLEPYIYHESTGIMFEAFRGASVQLEHDLAGGTVKLDLFGGAPVFFEGDEAEETHYGLVGGRLQYETPIEGLTIGGTVATTREHEIDENTGEKISGSKTLVGGSLEYKQAGLQLSSEYFQLRGMDHRDYSYYVEAGYTFFDKLTPFVRYDYYTTDKADKANPEKFQEGVAFGVGYRFNSFASIKVEDHIIRGFALPAIAHEEATGLELDGDKHWNLFAVSLNLMF